MCRSNWIPFSLASGCRRFVPIRTRFPMMLRLARGSVEIGERHSVVGCLGYIRDRWMDGWFWWLLKFQKYSFILLFIE
ncbi:hypothetical protein JHK84_029618 [Glycine max]|nr:hypothetical protein JHK87_029291 [Glycine soja]KAG5005351.1 hypothetical protein JHK86_029490 [Glycine max]KAG5153146.1 hypothetical protein JHK84_029618 [Glycine max]